MSKSTVQLSIPRSFFSCPTFKNPIGASPLWPSDGKNRITRKVYQILFHDIVIKKCFMFYFHCSRKKVCFWGYFELFWSQLKPQGFTHFNNSDWLKQSLHRQAAILETLFCSSLPFFSLSVCKAPLGDVHITTWASAAFIPSVSHIFILEIIFLQTHFNFNDAPRSLKSGYRLAQVLTPVKVLSLCWRS